MLSQLAITNIVLVERLELEFARGLGVLTGETGAGKSILLDALGLALGARADSALVRSGQSEGSVSAELALPAGHPLFVALKEQGISCDPGEALIVRRTVKADGGSRAFIGGVAVPAALLRELGAGTVEIHGQHDDRAAMQAGVKAGEALTGLDDLLGGSDGALSQLRQAARKIERGAAEHPLLAEALAALDRALIEASEADERIARAADALTFDPARLEQAETRLFDIRALARKHRVEPDALAALGDHMRAQLAAIEAGGETLAALERQLSEATEAYGEAASALSEQRGAAALKLDAAVAAELAPLKLDAARFRTAIAPAEPGPTGSDRLEFEVSTNPGAPFGQLTKIASGGELSRFILALKVALAEAGSAATMIFDEIDRGVGGAVASAIGERLARLAQQSQVLVVTHSPQVAARAAHHYRIEKSHGAEGTRTAVRKLEPAERREEIARMLSGASVTDEARAQATRLLDAA